MTQVELARHLNKPQSYAPKVEILERRLDLIGLTALNIRFEKLNLKEILAISLYGTNFWDSELCESDIFIVQ